MAVRERDSDMGSYEWAKWLRLNGFDRPHPYPGSDLGYDGRDLERFSLVDIEGERWDVRWQDPVNPDGWLCAVAPVVIEDLEAWR